ncbi:MAG: hypothetical protein ACRBCJ_05545 [Hyphomicrobiaceae bacterium]
MKTLLLALSASVAFAIATAPIASAAKKCPKGYILTQKGKCVYDDRGS